MYNRLKAHLNYLSVSFLFWIKEQLVYQFLGYTFFCDTSSPTYFAFI
jgi:hypothetical protein